MKKHLFPMKELLVLLIMLVSISASAQFDKKKERISLPEKLSANVDGVQINLIYNSPEAKGRKIFGGLVPFGKRWRTGANEATIIEFSEDVQVNGQLLKKGKYAFYSIPSETDWVLIFNKEYDQWGDFNYDQKMDALRLNVQPLQSEFREKMEFEINKDGDIVLFWEETKVPFRVKRIP